MTALSAFLQEAKRRGGHDLIARAQALLRRGAGTAGHTFSDAERSNVAAFEARMRFLYEDPDGDWLEARIVEIADEYDARPQSSPQDDLPEMRG